MRTYQRAHDGPCTRPATLRPRYLTCGCAECRAHWAATRPSQATGRRGARLRAVVENYLEMTAQGETRSAIARRLGYKNRDGLDAALRRGRAKGLL